MNDFKTALDALTKDAKRWDDTADMLKKAKGDCAAMTLRTQDFTFLGGDVYKEYEAARKFMEDYLGDGESATSKAAAALRKVKAAYEGTDQLTKAEIDKIKSDWKPE
jgi:uncharacterized protein YukE